MNIFPIPEIALKMAIAMQFLLRLITCCQIAGMYRICNLGMKLWKSKSILGQATRLEALKSVKGVTLFPILSKQLLVRCCLDYQATTILGVGDK